MDSNYILSSDSIVCLSLHAVTQPSNSILGIVTCLEGANLLFANNNLLQNESFSNFHLIYAHAP